MSRQLGADERVEPDGRLVEEQHTWMRDERTCDLEPSSFAAAVAADRPVDEVGEPEGRRDLLDPSPCAVDTHAPETSVDVEVPPAGQRPVDDRILEHDAADAPRRQRLAADVEAGDAGATRS